MYATTILAILAVEERQPQGLLLEVGIHDLEQHDHTQDAVDMLGDRQDDQQGDQQGDPQDFVGLD